MPKINDYVNYGMQGICKIEDFRPMKFRFDCCKQDYYILKPVHQETARIFVPARNQELVKKMRPILSSEAIDEIILSVKKHNLPWIDDERELLQLASCLYLKSKDSTKGLCSSDAQILKKAEAIISQEFSFSLNISAQKVGIYIREKLGIPHC